MSNNELVERVTAALGSMSIDIYSFDEIESVKYWNRILPEIKPEMIARREEIMKGY